MTRVVSDTLRARPVPVRLPAELTSRWQVTFTAPLRPALVPIGAELLLYDGAGSVFTVQPRAPGLAFAGWDRAPWPAGAFRSALGAPLFVAAGGRVFRVGVGMRPIPVFDTGCGDVADVGAFGLDDGVILAMESCCIRVGTNGSVVWKHAASWSPQLADDDVIVATEADELLIIDALTGIERARHTRRGAQPFALIDDAVWLRNRSAELHAIHLFNGAQRSLALVGPYPHPCIDHAGRTFVCSGSLALEWADLTSARVERTIELPAPEAWPLLLAADDRVLYRDAADALVRLDSRSDFPVQLLADTHVIAAEVADLLYVLTEELDDKCASTLHCFGPRADDAMHAAKTSRSQS